MIAELSSDYGVKFGNVLHNNWPFFNSVRAKFSSDCDLENHILKFIQMGIWVIGPRVDRSRLLLAVERFVSETICLMFYGSKDLK